MPYCDLTCNKLWTLQKQRSTLFHNRHQLPLHRIEGICDDLIFIIVEQEWHLQKIEYFVLAGKRYSIAI